MYIHCWDCDRAHAEFDCPRTYPTSNVRTITALDRHVQQALALANADAIDASMSRHPAGKAL